MVRLYLFAEGQTEQTFANMILKNHLAHFGVFLHRPALIAHGRKKGKTLRGGGSKYLPMKNDIRKLLAQEKGPAVFFTTMIDLYAIPTKFPGMAEGKRLRDLPYKRVEALEKAFAKDIGDPRFLPFIQLHEFEAYLFADPNCLSLFYDHHKKQIAELNAIASKYDSPELIDDQPHSAPSKRIISTFPDYRKTIEGPLVAEQIGLDTIRAKCPHFAKWLSRLENLASTPKE